MYYVDEDAFDYDPYLEAMPAFTYAMPVQIVVLGMTITLLSVLFVHLLFTVRYHLPLSRLNYWFQITAVAFSIARTSVELHTVVTQLISTPKEWPYMFDYIEVYVPPTTWNLATRIAWHTVSMLSSLAVHCLHIQFLTLLFPSHLEFRLILGLLGPLALISSFLVYTKLSSTPAIEDLGDAIRNTANSTLTLLYTLAILIWGGMINRSRAWRTEGGTATFGIFALVLGLSGTAINFVEVKEDRMRWLPGVVNCVLLWQSWVGFWWWVGAGMWTGEVEDVQRKEEKRRRHAELKEAKREKRRATLAAAAAAMSTSNDANGSTRGTLSIRRRNAQPPAPPPPAAPPLPLESIELQPMGDASPGAPQSVSSGSTPPPVPSRFDPLYALFRPFLARLRVAHNEAAIAKAAEPRAASAENWGIRQLGLRGRRERGERRAERTVEEGAEEREGRRAGYVIDGGQRLEDDGEEEGESEIGESEVGESGTSGTGTEGSSGSSAGSTEPDQGRRTGATGPGAPPPQNARARWTQRGWVAKWRVKDRQEFP